MKSIILSAIALLASVVAANAQYYNSHRSSSYGYGYGIGSNSSSHYVRPHYQSNGDYVGGHYRTNPNNTTLDNYSTRGNYNPYTGQYGRRNSRGW